MVSQRVGALIEEHGMTGFRLADLEQTLDEQVDHRAVGRLAPGPMRTRALLTGYSTPGNQSPKRLQSSPTLSGWMSSA